jgi:hypothetical protein
MTARAGVARLAPAAGLALVALFALHDRFELVENRVLLLVGFAVAVAGLALRWRDVRSATSAASALQRRTLRAFAVFAAASVALAVLRVLVAPRAGLRDDLIAALVPPLVGWAAYLLLPVGYATPPAANAVAAPRATTRQAWMIAAAAFVAVWLTTLARAHFDNIDEVVYSFQAHRFALGDATWPADTALQRFVKLPLMIATPTGLHSHFPPGYPAVLSLFVALGVPALCGAVLGALAVLAVHRLGTRLAGPAVGALSALLLATHPLFLRWSATYMSHAAALTAVTLAAWLLLESAQGTDRRHDLRGALAGLLLGIAVAVRPVTGLAIGLSLWLALLAHRIGRPRLRRITLLLCVGGVLPLVGMLAYNAATNGHPLRLGYRVAQGHLNDLGFGRRGIVLYDDDVRPVAQASEFTPTDAVRNEIASVVWPFARDLFPVWGLLPLLAVAVAYRVRIRASFVAALAVLPIANFFFFANGERMHVELLPFAVVGAALLVARVREVGPRAAVALAVLLVGANLLTSAARIAGDWQRRRRDPSEVEVLARAVRDSSRTARGVLVFVRDRPLAEPLFLGLWRFNVGRFPGPVVVARDLGAANGSLACRLPGYRPLRADSATSARDARLVSFTDGLAAPGRCADPPLVSTQPPIE